MSQRNSGELGVNLSIIAKRLLSNQKLCKYLKYTNDSPLDNPDIINPAKDILHKNIKIVPLVNVEENTTESTVVIVLESASVDEDNTEFNKITLSVQVYTPLREWQINDINLRPFLIISEIEKTLRGKRIEGLGKITYHGFSLELLTADLSGYRMEFDFDVFS
jgi:hypothetical protein